VEADLLIGALLVLGVLLGVFRGALRQLIIVGAWVVVFMASVYLRQTVGDFILGNVPQSTCSPSSARSSSCSPSSSCWSSCAA
jgi:uncharacterized membrane protein required for colicin V production